MPDNYIMMRKAFLIILIFLSSFCLAQVKNIGSPNIRNYSKSEYNGSTQNWDIAQDQNGIMYFANNDGLLSFDGSQWNLTRVSFSSPLRSVLIDKNNNLFVGLINDFGIIIRENSKPPVFVSLKHLLPDEYQNFDDIWNIHEINDGMVFQCFKYLFIYKEGTIKVLEPQVDFHFSFQIKERLFIHEPESGIFELVDGKIVKLPFWDDYLEQDISAILEKGNGQVLICTSANGIYKMEDEKMEPWDTPVNNFIKKNRLYSATSLPGNYFAFGTILNGLVIADGNGNIIQSINSRNGLQNNTILSLFVDRTQNLWLGLDNGIDYVEINSPLRFFNSENLGTGYCCTIFEGNLYLGTNQGLYVRPFDEFDNDHPFELVKNTAGQVWSLEVFDGELICGHNQGVFKVKGNTATKTRQTEGTWRFIQLNTKPEFLLGGCYNGLILFKEGDNGWNFYKKLEGFRESSRYIQQDKEGDIWIGHGGKGIFRVKLNDTNDSILQFIHYTKEYGLPSNTGNILLGYKKNMYASTDSGIFRFDKTTNRFVLSEEMNRIFNTSAKIKTLTEDEEGDIWYIADNESGIIRKNEDQTFTKITAPFKKLDNRYVNEFEFIYPYNTNNAFVGIDDGFAHYSAKVNKPYNETFSSIITKVEIQHMDSVVYLYEPETEEHFKFPFRKNSLRFHFAAPFFENEIPMQFSYFLEGFSEDWSPWSTHSYKDFTTLHEGNYQFKLKAKNSYGIESDISSFAFEILPPWHRSGIAYLVYILMFGLLVFLITKLILKRLERAKEQEKIRHQQEIRKQEEQHQREALVAEKEIIKLRNDKLRAEMIHRDKELANQTMGIVQKNKFMIKVNEDLNAIQDFVINETAKNRILSLKKRIKKEVDIKQQSQIFETYFDEVHEEFFKKLKERYPNLSPNDLRICAFIRMNLTTKEIATILNISYRGAEISRYRLRKKLELDRSANLSTFLSNI